MGNSVPNTTKSQGGSTTADIIDPSEPTNGSTGQSSFSHSISCPSRDDPNAVVRISEYSKSSTSHNESLLAISLEEQQRNLSPCYSGSSYESDSGSSCERSIKSLPNPNRWPWLHEELEGSDRHVKLTQSREFTPPVEEKKGGNLGTTELEPLLEPEDPRVACPSPNELSSDERVLLEQSLEGRRVEEVYNMVFHVNSVSGDNGDCHHTALVENMDICRAGDGDPEPVEHLHTVSVAEGHVQDVDTDVDIYSVRGKGTPCDQIDERDSIGLTEELDQSLVGSREEQDDSVEEQSLVKECLPQESHDGDSVHAKELSVGKYPLLESKDAVEVYDVGFSGMITLSCEEPDCGECSGKYPPPGSQDSVEVYDVGFSGMITLSCEEPSEGNCGESQPPAPEPESQEEVDSVDVYDVVFTGMITPSCKEEEEEGEEPSEGNC